MKQLISVLGLGALDCVLGLHEYSRLGPKFFARREGQFHRSVMQEKTCLCCGKVKRIVVK